LTDNTGAGRVLLPHHREHLRGSGLTDSTIEMAGIYSETGAIGFPVFGVGGSQIVLEAREHRSWCGAQMPRE
jgi:hypothetical protein